MTFSFGKTVGDPVGPPRTWKSGSPWVGHGRHNYGTHDLREGKHSQLRRDQKKQRYNFDTL